MALTTHHHRLYGLTIEAPFRMPGAPVVGEPAGGADVVVDWSETGAEALRPGRVTQPSDRAGAPEIGVAENGDTCLAWSGRLLFRISPDLRRVHAHSAAALLDCIPVVTLGMVLGLLLQKKGVLCLHGCALAWRGGALAILGGSGMGKSTLAAALVRRGAGLLTDDVIALRTTPRGPAVEGGTRGIRLLQDAVDQAGIDDARLSHVPYVDKRLWDLSAEHASQAEAGPAPLRALYVLQPGRADGPAQGLTLLPPSQALRALVPNWYPPQLVKQMRVADLDRLAALARDVPMQALSYAHTWDNLSRVATQLLS